MSGLLLYSQTNQFEGCSFVLDMLGLLLIVDVWVVSCHRNLDPQWCLNQGLSPAKVLAMATTEGATSEKVSCL